MPKKPNKNGKTAQLRGLLNLAMVPKGGLKSSIPFPAFTQQF
jgi:hypothetical protein